MTSPTTPPTPADVPTMGRLTLTAHGAAQIAARTGEAPADVRATAQRMGFNVDGPPLTFEEPPAPTDATPTRDEIRAALAARPGMWAVVARPDRAARADAMASRVNGGREYGPGHEARVVKIGPEFRVYARRTA